MLRRGLAALPGCCWRAGVRAPPGARALSSVCTEKIHYRSTRGGQSGLTFDEAVLQGLGTDRGLLVPERIPTFSPDTLESWRGLPFQDLAFEIMSMYLTREEMPADALRDIIGRSYGTFRDTAVTPVVPSVDGLHVLELFHGPTFAFKDVALQFLGNLFEHLLKQRPGQKITVVGATSGDTGSSAIHGLRGKQGVECFIMYPEGRTSPIQEQQMITVTDPNIHNIALKGTFDDCQRVVKTLFADAAFRNEYQLAAVNSINWARILAQTVYYVYAYLQVTTPAAAGAPPTKVSFSVPTGNFGDILAGWYAKQMGLPVADLIVATNENDILHRFWQAGDYSKAGVKETVTPSMDIAISSNFERFLFHMGGDDTAALAKLMTNFEQGGDLQPPPELLAKCQAEMTSQRVDNAQCLATISDVHARADGYTLDPHSAIGVAAAQQHLSATGGVSSAATPVVSLACAHWAKFLKAVGSALGEEKLKALPMPPELACLAELPSRVKVLPNEDEAVKGFIKETIAARRA